MRPPFDFDRGDHAIAELFWDGRESNQSSGIPADTVHYRKVLFRQAFQSHWFLIVPRGPDRFRPVRDKM